MNDLFALLTILLLGALITGVIKPDIFKRIFKGKTDRKNVAIWFGLATVVSFIAFGITAPPVIDEEQNASAETILPEESLDTQPQNEMDKEEVDEAFYLVSDVVDGDTIKVEVNGTIESIRLIGIDTPETVHPSQPVQCFGKEASARAKELLENQNVKLENDPTQGDRDKYNRLLRYVILEDGTNFNLKMISDGYAFEYTYVTPYKYQTEFKEAELTARNGSKGLWSEGTCDGDREVSSQNTQPPTQTNQNNAPSNSNCDPNYSGGCVPLVSHDLDCGDIGFSVVVVGTDKHRFDGDRDGHGCESY